MTVAWALRHPDYCLHPHQLYCSEQSTPKSAGRVEYTNQPFAGARFFRGNLKAILQLSLWSQARAVAHGNIIYSVGFLRETCIFHLQAWKKTLTVFKPFLVCIYVNKKLRVHTWLQLVRLTQKKPHVKQQTYFSQWNMLLSFWYWPIPSSTMALNPKSWLNWMAVYCGLIKKNSVWWPLPSWFLS